MVEIFSKNAADDGCIALGNHFTIIFNISFLGFSSQSAGKQFQQICPSVAAGKGKDQRNAFFPLVEVVFFDELKGILVRDVLEDISDEAVCSFGEESLESVAEKVLTAAVSNDQSLSCPSALQSCINGSLVIANKDVLFHESFLAQVPVEIARYHVVLNAVIVLILFVIGILLERLSVYIGEESKSILALNLGVCLWLVLCAFLLLAASCKLTLFACVFFNLLHYLAFAEAKIVEYFSVIFSAFGLD